MRALVNAWNGSKQPGKAPTPLFVSSKDSEKFRIVLSGCKRLSGTRVIATQIGFMRFPEEILLHIVFFCLGDIEDDHEGYMKKIQQLHILAAVCRRFRDIIISRPKIWTKVTNDMDHDEISCFLARSKPQEMSIVMRSNNEAPRRTSKALRIV